MGFPTWGELAMLGSALLFLLVYGIAIGVHIWRNRRLTVPQLVVSLLVGFAASFLCFFILAAALVRKVA